MKRISLLPARLLGTLLLAAAPFANVWAIEAVTEPVAVIPIKVNGGTTASPTLSPIAPSLVHPVGWQGPVAAVSSTVISAPEGNWNAGEFSGSNGSHYVEILDGPNAGRWSTITACGADTVTTAEDLSALLAVGNAIAIRKHVTLNDFLGASNTAGLQGGTSPLGADEVAIYNGAAVTTCWYLNNPVQPSKSGWYTVSGTPAGSFVIAPNQGVIVKRKTATAATFLTAGTVKSGPTALLIQPGINVIGSAAAQGMTLAKSGLFTGNAATGVKGATSALNADQITLYSDGVQTTYWYLAHPTNANLSGWYNSRAQQANTVAIAPGTSLLIQRRNGGAAFQWIIPAP